MSDRWPPELPTELPLIAVKNAVVFPITGLPVPLVVGRDRTMKAIEQASTESGLLFVVSQKDADDEDPGPDDLFEIGTVARILRLSRGAMEGGHELVIEGLHRARLDGFVTEVDHQRVNVSVLPETNAEGPEIEALVVNLRELAHKVIRLSPRLPDEARAVIDGIENPSHLADLVASQIRLSTLEKQAILELTDVRIRLAKVIEHVAHEAAVLEISANIRTEVRDTLDKHQREVYLREQLRAIRKKLGDDVTEGDDLEELDLKVAEAGMPEAALKATQKELKRLARMSPQSAEYTVSRTYVDWMLDVPWTAETEDNLDLKAAQELLDQDHYGLTKVKRRMVEYLAVRKLKGDLKGPILCLVGPPGVGKTSLGRSIARALGRQFVQVSLGGMRDEAEIRGHRRTYIGAMPGRIIKGLKRAATKNPVFVLDEIDKLGHDFRGDPASALLEVLDPEQNHAFSDHYLEVATDLSNVLFMTTANRLDTIPPPLLDRMEVIEIPGYIEEEKLAIARRHLLPRQLDDHGLKPDQVEMSDAILSHIISHYTREAGVRNLSRQIASVLRTVARDVAIEQVTLPVVVDEDRVRAALGPQRHFPEDKEDIAEPGVAVGLAWTPVGGDILFIEATDMHGQGKLTLTGQLGEVMKESAHAAMSFLHSRADEYGLSEDQFAKRNFHIHVPSGAIPKDGPSAGVTLVAAMASLLTGRTMRDGLAMTGEITLRGRVLPVGGIKEKVLAAHRAGIKEVLLPKRNEGDLEEIPKDLRDDMRFHLVERIDDVLKLALGLTPLPPEARKPRLAEPATPAEA